MAEEVPTFRCGHPRSEENTGKNGNQHGTCKICHNARGRSKYARKLEGRQPREMAGHGQRQCKTPDCGGLHLARGFCRLCYQRAATKGLVPSHRTGICSTEDCDRPVRARELCRTHYQHLMRSGAPILLERNIGRTCTEIGCDRAARSKGMCNQHYAYWKAVTRYGISREQYLAMVESQGNRCAVCGADSPGNSDRWFIDHDHGCCPEQMSCGACVRGLLCNHCNLALGLMNDSPDRLMAAAAYLLSRTDLLNPRGAVS